MLKKNLLKHWNKLYPDHDLKSLDQFMEEIDNTKKQLSFKPHQAEWFKDAIVYSLYVDLFNQDFIGLKSKLDYLQDLGVNCLWLLPILDSPMKDAGFDIRHYDRIRADLMGLPDDASLEDQRKLFREFLKEAHDRGIKVIFDIAINHTSDEHPWFQESRKSEHNPYRDYYIWSKDTNLYKEARIIFEGLEESNWKKDGDSYYFHRFFEFQPDLNYRNPEVLLAMTRHFLFWLTQGVDGFRADAIPYLWKEDGTTCENHPMLHHVVKFMRSVVDYVRPHTLLLAEACQRPNEVVKYFGDGDECNAGYHFPLMPQIFKSLAASDKEPVQTILSTKVTPVIPEAAQWFTFLRCHDELSLELVYVSEADRKYIHDNYCKKPEWDFRLGQGVAARLSELLDRNPQKIGLAFSIMLSLPGTPIVYYGDEFGKLNDHDYYSKMIKLSGKDDTRFLVRGRINWHEVEEKLANTSSFQGRVYYNVKTLLNARKNYQCFGRGDITWIEVADANDQPATAIMAYVRSYQNEKVLVVQNLSEQEFWVKSPIFKNMSFNDLLGKAIVRGKEPGYLMLKPLEYLWIRLSN
ncbi:MAG: alpha-glucosidase C-terminal domain-containing protein [Bacteroidetes bacterium]|nr:alpha-glucosidase C-terminal domain-containing protein [Bacteroidota bacterium]